MIESSSDLTEYAMVNVYWSSITLIYRKIPKIGPGAYIFQRAFLRGLSMEGNLCFKLDRASLIVRSKFTIFSLFYVVFEGNFPPRG